MVAKAAIALVIVGVLLGNAQSTSADQYTDQIGAAKHKKAQVQQQIASLQAQIAAAQNHEAQLSVIISGLDGQIATTEAQVASAKAQLGHTEANLAAAQVRLATEQSQLAAEKRQLSRELIVIYELQQQSTPLKNLLKSGNFNEFWTQLIDSRRISASELTLVYQVQAKEAEIQVEVNQIAAERVQQAAEVIQLQTTQNELTQQRVAQQQALNYLAALQAQDQQAEQQAEAAVNAINAQIAKLQSEEQAALAAGGGSGRFVWPDNGPISQGFGCTSYNREPPASYYGVNCPRSEPYYHNGIDIAGPYGHAIVAADAGIAQTYSWGSCGYTNANYCGFGNYIIIVHGNGWYTLYGHLSGFAIGGRQAVSRGQTIGYEGSTGNSSGPHLHFGVSYNGVWVNPLRYLS